MIIVLGAAGMLGHKIWQHLNTLYPNQVFGTLRNATQHYDQFNLFDERRMLQVDVADFAKLEACLDKVKPQWIINCIGLTLRKPDLADLEKCIEINSMLPHRLKAWAANNSSKVIHFSTDCVFDGKKGNYSLNDAPSATDLYGKSKYLGEISGPHALTLRLSIVGRELEKKTELLEWLLAQKKQKIKGYSKVIYSGLSTLRVAHEVAKIIQKHPDLNGIYQLASQPISKFELLKLFNIAFKVEAEIEEFEGYTSDKSLNSEAYSKATGFVAPNWKDMTLELLTDKSVSYERY